MDARHSIWTPLYAPPIPTACRASSADDHGGQSRRQTVWILRRQRSGAACDGLRAWAPVVREGKHAQSTWT